MKLEVRKEISELYYIRSRNGVGIHEKTFVRIYKKLKNGTNGSMMYSSSRNTALLFDNYELAKEFMNKYNTSYANVAKYDYEKYTPQYMKENYILEEVKIKGITCYRFVKKQLKENPDYDKR